MSDGDSAEPSSFDRPAERPRATEHRMWRLHCRVYLVLAVDVPQHRAPFVLEVLGPSTCVELDRIKTQPSTTVHKMGGGTVGGGKMGIAWRRRWVDDVWHKVWVEDVEESFKSMVVPFESKHHKEIDSKHRLVCQWSPTALTLAWRRSTVANTSATIADTSIHIQRRHPLCPLAQVVTLSTPLPSARTPTVARSAAGFSANTLPIDTSSTWIPLRIYFIRRHDPDSDAFKENVRVPARWEGVNIRQKRVAARPGVDERRVDESRDDEPPRIVEALGFEA
ncbi:hypothetical protein BJ912DRAFT_1065676 [Pholiota molesta]|nr:hypothetical protein BJ912DRAFT_1065676 [Pholiota molesta]